MTLTTRLAHIGGVLTLALGLAGLFAPGLVARFLSITPVGRLGVSEIRATWGGLFLAMGVTVLLARDTTLFALVGVAWVGAAAGRSISWWYDRSREQRNLLAIGVELVLGYLLLAPIIAIWWRGLLA
jgi:uncharacterized membrane protein